MNDVEREILSNLTKDQLLDMIQRERRDATRHLKRYIDFEQRMRKRILSLLLEADSEFDVPRGKDYD